MELSENFKSHISAEDAINICYKYPTIDVMYNAHNCYNKAYNQYKEDSDINWKHYSGLAAVYIMGFISGGRAVRERKRNRRSNCNA